MTTFDALLNRHPWRPIPGCPGRFVLEKTTVTPLAIAGIEVAPERYDSAPGRDPVVIVRFPDGGGLISFERPNGFVHTLNTPEGLRRKLMSLGIAAPEGEV